MTIKQEAHGPWRSAWEPTWPLEKVPHLPSFYTRGRNWTYFHIRSSGFRDTGRFSKLPYLSMKLGHWSKCQKLHIYCLSTPGCRNWAYFCSTGSGFRAMGRVFKIAIFGHETWPLTKLPEIQHIPSFYPRMSKLCSFSLYGQWLVRYGPIFKIAIFGHETWQVAKVS